MNERARGALLGLAVGDALGTTYEFDALEQRAYPELATGPATDVVGGGPFDVAPGAITDDTQMAVCLARSLAERGRLDAGDVARRYVAWTDEAFDIGNQTRDALQRIASGTPPEEAGLATWRQSGRRAAGNGSLMRTAPVAVAIANRRPHHGRGGAVDPFPPEVRREAAVIDAAMADSMITHADPRCVLACAAFDAAIVEAIVASQEGNARAGVASAGGAGAAGVGGPGAGAARAGVAGAGAAREGAVREGVAAAGGGAAGAGSALEGAAAAGVAGESGAGGPGTALKGAAAAGVAGAAGTGGAGTARDGASMLTAARRALGIAAVRLAERWRDTAGIERDDLAAIESARADLERDLEAAAADDPRLYTPELHLHRTAGFVRVAFRLAFWHCVHTPSWRAALVDIASRGGDADTNAAIAGALLGARDGASAIPLSWVERVLAATQQGSAAWAEAHHPRHLLALAE